MARRVEVALGEGYPVVIGAGVDVGEVLPEKVEPGAGAVITDQNVGRLHLASVRRDLERAGWKVLEVVEVPAGEGSKSLSVYADCVRALARSGLPRDGTVFALGGGVVGDLGGFVAASYLRGVRLVMLPTTLLAMVDSSVGGKTGVDLPEGKNLVGAFLQPEAVVADLERLSTLDSRQISNGLAEVVKMGLLCGGTFFKDLEGGVGAALGGDLEATQRLVEHSVGYKASVVAADERESGLRAILNYGHTVGHALEAASGYDLAHGEAVALGMCAAARLSEERFGADLVEIHEELLGRANLPTRAPDFARDEVFEAMSRDKKRRSKDAVGEYRFVLLEEIGRPKWGVPVTGEEALRAIPTSEEV